MIATLTLADLHLARHLYGGAIQTDATGARLVGALVAGTRVNFGPVRA